MVLFERKMYLMSSTQ